MTTILYAHDGESLYDSFFLNHLAKGNSVCLLTFSEKPKAVSQGVHVRKMKELFHPTTPPLTGLNTYLGFALRAIILKLHINRIKHDILIGCGGLSYGFYSALTSPLSGFILFIWGSDVLVAPRHLPFRFISKYSLKKATAVVVDSVVQEKACKELGCDPKKIVRFPWFDPTPVLVVTERNAGHVKVAKKQLCEKQRWGEDDPIIISTRHHEPIYDVECLIEAIPLIVKEVKNARFLILGKGSLTKKLMRKVEVLGVEDNVAFLGWVQPSEIPKYLQMSTIYASTSLSDGTSASLLEAMACKLPPIVTDIQGNREWIASGRNGLLFPATYSGPLAEKIVQLLRDEKRRESLGIKAYETVIDKADWRRNSELLDNLISVMVNLK